MNSFVQNIMHFRDSSLVNPDAPIERVAVFDEAQRAWDAKHLANFMSQKKGQTNFQMSEPEFLISVMDRHQDWCTVICLIGGGQEINAGEAGLTEWFSALQKSFRNWKIYTSEQIAHRDYHWGQDLLQCCREWRANPGPRCICRYRSDHFVRKSFPISLALWSPESWMRRVSCMIGSRRRIQSG